jgi:hypothetical protein
MFLYPIVAKEFKADVNKGIWAWHRFARDIWDWHVRDCTYKKDAFPISEAFMVALPLRMF